MSNFQFRIRAVNKEGESDPLVTGGDGFLAKNPYDVPGKMDKPEVVDWDKDHVDLQWKAPDDGGSPIEEYALEIKDKHGKWTEAMRVRIYWSVCNMHFEVIMDFKKFLYLA